MSHLRARQIMLLWAFIFSFTGPLYAEPSLRGFVFWDSGWTDEELAANTPLWTAQTGLETSVMDGNLVFDIKEPDARVTRDPLSLTPSSSDTFLVRYRAQDFADLQTGGEIFFQNENHAFEGNHYVIVPSLILDGQWHEMLIPVKSSLRGELDDWTSGGPITAFRFDLVNQAPGHIEVDLLMLTPSLKPSSEESVRIDSPRWFLVRTDSFVQTGPRRFSRTLRLPEGDFAVWAHLLDTAPGRRMLDGLEISGVMGMSPDGPPSGEHHWLNTGTCGGGEVTFTVSERPSVFLDAILIAEGTNPPHDEFVDVPTKVPSEVQPMMDSKIKPLRPYWTGMMLSCPRGGTKDTAGNAHSFFRRVFEVPTDMADAWVQLSVDDNFRLFINGELVQESNAPNAWMTPSLIEVTEKLRRGERNVIAVEAVDTGGEHGMLFDLTLNRRDHSFSKIVSDKDWRSSENAAKGWESTAFDDSHWVTPDTKPGPPNAPWNVEIPYEDKTWQAPTECVHIDIKKGLYREETQQAKVLLRSERPLKAGEVVRVFLTNAETGNLIGDRETVLSAERITALPDGTFEVSGLTAPSSRWFPAHNMRLGIQIYGRALAGLTDEQLTFTIQESSTTPRLESRVDMVSGVPRLVVNGTAIYPMIGNGEGRHKDGTRGAYKNAGFNIEATWVDPMGPDQWWLGTDAYSFEIVDVKMAEALDFDPEVLVLPIIWAAPPPWWQDLHPDEMARFSSGETWNYYKSAHSFSSDVWKQDAARALTALVQHMESAPYASHVLGYWIVGGVSAEWQGWGCHASYNNKHLMDYSRPEVEGFRRFLQMKYPEKAASFANTEIPAYEDRIRSELGVFRDPGAARSCIDFVEFYSESMADAILNCAGAVKNAMGRSKIVGVYFGYSLEYTNMSWSLQMSGHNRLRKVLDSSDIDFLSAPPSYSVRRAGQDSAWMWTFRSIQNAGKLVWVDDDTRTFLSGMADYTPAITLDQTRQVLRRNFAKAVCCLCPEGYLQINSGRELDHPLIAEDIRAIRRAGEYTIQHNVTRKAEIAAVVDEDSVKYLGLDGANLQSGEVDRITSWNGDVRLVDRSVNTLTGDLISYQRDRIARIGAPVDYVLFSDIKARDLDYKFYIMLSCFQYDDAVLSAVRQKIYDRGATVLWCYAPGFIHEGKADIANMEPLTGFRFAMSTEPSSPRINITDFTHPFFVGETALTSFGVKYSISPLFYVTDNAAQILGTYQGTGLPSLAVKKVGEATSIFCGSNKLTTPLIRGIAREAGVHLYSCSGDPFEANDRFALLHTSTGGDKTISLRAPADVVDVFTGEIVAANAARFTVNVPAEQTRFWFIGDAKDFPRERASGS